MPEGPADTPDAAEFGQWRAKMARRGFPQWWIDLNLGTDPNKPNGIHALNTRQGYLINQIRSGSGGVVDIDPIVVFLTDEGWNCALVNDKLLVAIQIDGEWNYIWITAEELLQCDYTNMPWPDPLKNDLSEYMQQAGLCP